LHTFLSFEKGGQGGFGAFVNPPKSPFAKGGLFTHMPQGLVFLVFTQTLETILQKVIANVPPLLKRGGRGDLKRF
jgi:hypothetical protein